MSKTKIASLLCLAVIIVFSVSSVSAATENKIQSVSKNNEFKQNLKNLDTTNPVTKEIKKTGTKTYDLPQASGSSVQVDENTKAIKVKFNGKEFKITDKDTKALTNELVSGSLIRKNSNGDVASSVEAVDGGLRMVLNIEKTIDKFYTYDFPVEAESGTKYVLVGQGAKLVSSTGAMIVAMTNPWATDSNKKALKTWYTVENNGAVLRQHVDLTNAKFPVLADPTWCGNQIESVNWVWRGDEDGWTLRIIPTWCGRNSDPNLSWIEVLYKTPKSNLWNPYNSWSPSWWSMNNQYLCHAVGSSTMHYKYDWNIEPQRPLVSWAWLLLKNCNP